MLFLHRKFIPAFWKRTKWMFHCYCSSIWYCVTTFPGLLRSKILTSWLSELLRAAKILCEMLVGSVWKEADHKKVNGIQIDSFMSIKKDQNWTHSFFKGVVWCMKCHSCDATVIPLGGAPRSSSFFVLLHWKIKRDNIPVIPDAMWDLRVSSRWVLRLPSSEILRLVLCLTEASEQCAAFIIRV